MFKELFPKKSKENIFWSWFSLNAEKYYSFEHNQEQLFTQLKIQLGKIHPDIVFEFSPVLADKTREFVISADGIKSAFPAVIKLVEEAPLLKNWKVIAFRQPRKNVSKVNYRGLVINLDDVFFKYGKDSGKVALELHIRNFHESPEWTAGSFILLDNVIGEYHVETSLSSISKKNLKEEDVINLFPIRDLPKVIYEYHLELTN